MAAPRTLFQKILDSHTVSRDADGTTLMYIDRHLIHEVTSPQAFEGLRLSGRTVHRPSGTLAVPDHNVPTSPGRVFGPGEEEGKIQLETLERNVREFGVPYIPMDDIRQGIVHIVGPEQGMTQPGMTIVCGDSHTATHGAFGALAFGIGTSEVEHVLATQTLLFKAAKSMRVTINGTPAPGITGKDLVLAVIGKIGTAGGTGHVIEYAGSAIEGPVDGGPDDRLQHVDRGRRPRRADRARRQDLRLSRRPADGSGGRGLGPGGRLLAHLARRTRARLTTPKWCSTRPRSRRRSPGAPARRTCCPVTANVPRPRIL